MPRLDFITYNRIAKGLDCSECRFLERCEKIYESKPFNDRNFECNLSWYLSVESYIRFLNFESYLHGEMSFADSLKYKLELLRASITFTIRKIRLHAHAKVASSVHAIKSWFTKLRQRHEVTRYDGGKTYYDGEILFKVAIISLVFLMGFLVGSLACFGLSWNCP